MSELEKLINPDDQPEETPEQAEITRQLRQMAGELGQKQRQKTWGEAIFSEYLKTRKSKVRGTEIQRGEAFRFERGQIFKAYMNIRQEIWEAEERGEKVASKKALLKEMRERAKVVERDLDEINRQFYENVKEVEIETKDGKFTVPVVELDLKKSKEGENYDPEKDDRIPEVYASGAVSNFHQNACYLMARALEGHKVCAPMTPEQPSVKKPEGFIERLQEKGNLEPYADIIKALIKQMGLEEFDLSGWSMGAAVALEVASDPELEGLNNLTIMEPLGLQDKGFLRMGWEFAVSQGIKTLTSSETKIKALDQGADFSQAGLPALINAGNILSKKHFTPEKLANIKPEGRFQVWIGDKSPIMNAGLLKNVFSQAETLRQQKDPENSPLEFYTVKGADHGLPMVNALGLSRMIDRKESEKQFTTLKNSDLKNSAAEWMLKDIETQYENRKK